MAEIAEVVVVGAGTMGSQIALQTAYSGRHRVTLADSNFRQLEHARAQNEALTRRGVEKGRLTGDEAAAALERIRPATDLAQALATADLVIDEETVRIAMDFVRGIDRVPVLVNKEVHGFIVNRILFAAAEEAFHLLEGGYASVEDIDTAVRKGLRGPMGPFQVLDFSGLDIFYSALEDRRRHEGGPGAPASLREKVEKGELGRKTGKGFYAYSGR